MERLQNSPNLIEMDFIKNNNIAGTLYVIFISLALLFHVFNNIQLSDSVKMFHLFSGAAIGVGFFLTKQKDQIIQAFYMLLIWSLVSCLLSPIDGAFMSEIKFLIVALSVSYIPEIPLKKLILFVNGIIPIALIVLVRVYFSAPIFRYEGFYNDPNYFCTTLLVFFFYIQLLWNSTEKIVIKAGLLVEILIIFFLVGTSISRTGLACLFILTIVFWWDLFKKNKGATFIGVIILIVLVYTYFGDYLGRFIEGYTVREMQSNDTLNSAYDLRLEISMRGINYIFNHPQHLLQGLGLGTYSAASVLYGWQGNTIDHNTITSWFSEQGIIGLVLLLRFYVLTLKLIDRSEQLRDNGFRFVWKCVLGVFVLFSVSINMTNYLPYWFLLFTIIATAQD